MRDYTAWPQFIIRKNLIAFSVGHAERTHFKQFCAVWFLPERWFRPNVFGRFGHVVGGIYDKVGA